MWLFWCDVADYKLFDKNYELFDEDYEDYDYYDDDYDDDYYKEVNDDYDDDDYYKEVNDNDYYYYDDFYDKLYYRKLFNHFERLVSVKNNIVNSTDNDNYNHEITLLGSNHRICIC